MWSLIKELQTNDEEGGIYDIRQQVEDIWQSPPRYVFEPIQFRTAHALFGERFKDRGVKKMKVTTAIVENFE